MKYQTTSLLLAIFFGGLLNVSAQLSIPSDGSDGAFNPATNVEIDLGLAATATWNTSGSGNGVYDPDKWAVVFKYSSVNIPVGVKVTFKNHPSYAPVVWLVQGNVTIDGELNLDGKSGTNSTIDALIPPEPGPGGFRGGARSVAGSGAGYGPGGGNPTQDNFSGGAGRYLSRYGNPQNLPLLGGSGGGANASYSSGAGGGACLIAAANTIAISGLLSAKGGAGLGTAPGSGGCLRLIAAGLTGTGALTALAGSGNGGIYDAGRIRIEALTMAQSAQTFPETIAVQPATPPIIWPAANAPTAKVISVDAVNAPADPHAPLVAGADVAIQNSNQVNILIETQNFPIEGVVQLSVTPKFGNRTTLGATRLSGDITSANWRVQTVLPQGFVSLQARATQP